jgi:HSP20 family molecular chaperone IbpA
MPSWSSKAVTENIPPALPQAVDDTQARAEFRDGVLELDLPKKAGGNGKSLPIA